MLTAQAPAAFDDLRAAVVGGDGVVARYPGILVVARGPDESVRRLVDMCREVSGAEPGRPLARRLAAWLGGADAPPDDLHFGAVSVVGSKLAVFLNGDVGLHVPSLDTTISGADSAAWTDRLIPRPDAPVVLALADVAVPPGLPAGVFDLSAGVVPGVAVVALPSGTAAQPPAAPVPAAEPGSAPAPVSAPESAEALADHGHGHGHVPEQAAPVPLVAGETAETPVPEQAAPAPPAAERAAPVPEQAVPVPPALVDASAFALRPPRRAATILGAAPAEPARAPLEDGMPATVPGGEGAPAAPRTPEPDEPQAEGYLCSRGHLNDPRSHFCVICGIRMNERTGVLVRGPRPPLGLMVFDDGATYTVDAEYLLGRMPESDERVRSGGLRPIVVDDTMGSVSRAHAEIRLNGWDVLLVDSGSRNGTSVAAPGEQEWVPLRPQEQRRLEPGTRVRLGVRTFSFESPSGVR